MSVYFCILCCIFLYTMLTIQYISVYYAQVSVYFCILCPGLSIFLCTMLRSQYISVYYTQVSVYFCILCPGLSIFLYTMLIGWYWCSPGYTMGKLTNACLTGYSSRCNPQRSERNSKASTAGLYRWKVKWNSRAITCSKALETSWNDTQKWSQYTIIESLRYMLLTPSASGVIKKLLSYIILLLSERPSYVSLKL